MQEPDAIVLRRWGKALCDLLKLYGLGCDPHHELSKRLLKEVGKLSNGWDHIFGLVIEVNVARALDPN